MRFALLAVIVGSVILNSNLNAQIYQWVDKDGKTRFSDQPPAGHPDAAASTPVESRESSEQSSQRRSGDLLRAADESRPAILEAIRYKIQDSDLDEGIGKRYTTKTRFPMAQKKAPADCSFGKSEPLTTSYANRTLKAGRKQSQIVFHRLLREQGYSVADNSDSVFANQEAARAELSIAALIRKANYISCGSGRNSGIFDKAELTIEWQVFDNLTRQVLLTHEVKGDGTTYDLPPSNGNAALAFEKAIVDSAQQLLRKPEFRDALAVAGATAGGSSIVTNGSGLIDVKLNRGNSIQSFVDRSADIERGTVTVRTAGGHGSGFFISTDGYVITNAHVVAGSKRVLIVTSDAQFQGEIVRLDAQRDVALIKAGGTTDYPLKISTTEVRIGEQIYAVGTPLSEELSFSVTRGIISGKRSVNGLPLLQTDAAINLGNSGGPVLNENGDVVAISVSGIFSESGGSLNTNFVIPIDDALKKLGL